MAADNPLPKFQKDKDVLDDGNEVPSDVYRLLYDPNLSEEERDKLRQKCCPKCYTSLTDEKIRKIRAWEDAQFGDTKDWEEMVAKSREAVAKESAKIPSPVPRAPAGELQKE